VPEGKTRARHEADALGPSGEAAETAPSSLLSMAAAPKALDTLPLHQANERTLLAWIRTGIALMAFGFAVARFGAFLAQLARVGSGPVPPRHGIGSVWVGAALVALGMLSNLMATLRYTRIRRAIDQAEEAFPPANQVLAFGIAITVVGLVMTVLLVRTLGD
jgi:putative membrane protein